MKSLRPIGSPKLAAVRPDVDVAIVGAGAAGIGAARRCLAAGLTCCVLEAQAHVGGRCITVPVAGHPVDLGAHWLHAGSMNPLVTLGLEAGEPLSRAHQASRVIVDGRFADEATAREHRAAFETAGAALADAAEAEQDVSMASVLAQVGPELGRWRIPIEATFALISGRPLDEVSAKDYPSEEFGDNWFIRGGYGAYLARLADGLPIALNHRVRTIDWSGEGVVLQGDAGSIRAKAAIVTVPVPLLIEGIRFAPSLPSRQQEAAAAFLPGTYEHVVLNWPDSPFAEPDRLAKIVGGGASYGLMTRLDGTPLHYLEFDHDIAEVHGRDGGALATFARDWLAGQLGTDAVRGLSVSLVTDWVGDPWARCAWAVARPGRAEDRTTLTKPIGDRIWIAGEATSRRLWGTVGGAWEEGEAAASAIAARLSPRRDGFVQNPA